MPNRAIKTAPELVVRAHAEAEHSGYDYLVVLLKVSEMREFQAVPARKSKHRVAPRAEGDRLESVLGLQTTAGNWAVQRLLHGANAVQRDAQAPSIIAKGSPEEIRGRSSYRALEPNRLRDQISDLAVAGATSYLIYRDAIRRSTAIEKQAALNPVLLANLSAALDGPSFARCVESLGRGAPTFEQLRRNPTVHDAIAEAWKASDIGVGDLVTRAHEEGGWIFLNLIDGMISIVRAEAQFTDAIKLEPAPAQSSSDVLVATFHTHPTSTRPSPHDLVHDARRGVPNLVAVKQGSDPAKFEIRLSGPSARRHLASTTTFPGASGGIPP